MTRTAGSRFFRYLWAPVFGFLLASSAGAQEQFTEQTLTEAFRLAVRPTAQFDTLAEAATIRINGKDSQYQSQTVSSPNGCSLASIGNPSTVLGFNPDYAFRLTKRDSSDNAHWSVSLIALRSISPDLYETIKNSVSAQPGTLFEQANVDSSLVLGLLERGEVQLVGQKTLDTGQVELKLANSPEAVKAIAAYDDLKKKEGVPKSPPSTELPPPSAADKRPTEIKALRCVVEPNYGYLISELEITTAFFDGTTMTYRGSASEFQKADGGWYPKVCSYTRETGDYLESGNKQVVKLENTGRSSTETAYLRHYGLPEPELSRRFGSRAALAAGILLLLGLCVWAIKFRR